MHHYLFSPLTLHRGRLGSLKTSSYRSSIGLLRYSDAYKKKGIGKEERKNGSNDVFYDDKMLHCR